MQKHEIVEAAWASNIVSVKKKDETFRFCVDYRSSVIPTQFRNQTRQLFATRYWQLLDYVSRIVLV